MEGLLINSDCKSTVIFIINPNHGSLWNDPTTERTNMAQAGTKDNPITGPYRATKLWNEVICAFRQGVPATRHRRYMKTYDNCFTAAEAVDWLHAYLRSNCNFASEVTRCKIPSPVKTLRTPLRNRNDIINTNSGQPAGPIKLDLDLQLEPRPDIPECHIVAKELSSADTENMWKNVALDKLQQVLHMENLADILDSSLVVGRNILHNCVYVNKNQLPHWALSAMKCLAHWPQKVDDLPSYPGFERDVFRVVKEYFCGLDEPLMTYEMYEVILNVFIVADGSYQLLAAGPTSPDAMTSFESVENLLLDLTNTGSGSIGGPNDLDHTPLCRRRSAPSIDLSPIHPVTDQEKITNYETAFGPDNRTVTRVYYTNGVAMDYSKEEEAEVFAPIETHFESSEPLQVPECQTYQVNFAHVRPVTRRKSDSRKNGDKKSEAYRRRSYGPSSVGLVSSPSCGECTVQQSSRSYNGYISSRSSSQGEDGVTAVPTRSGFPRSKSSVSLHTCAHHDFQSQLLAECQKERQKHQIYESCESLPGRSLKLCEMDREERIKDALQLVCLLLPPANRRKLHLLLKLMGRMSDNPQIELDVNQTTRTLVLETFASCILSCHDDSDREDRLVMQIVSFLIDHYNHILSVPGELTSAVHERLTAATRTQFQKTYPDIYAERFPPHDSKSTEPLNQKTEQSKLQKNQRNSQSKSVMSQDPKAALPPKPKLKQPLLIAGSHIGTYEAYYKQADPNNTGSIGALDAASFLKKSSLPDTVLSQIWDLSDPSGKGYLEKTGFYVALKLVALAQNNVELNISKLTEMTPAPNLGPVEIKSESPTPSSSNVPWIITDAEKAKYDPVYNGLSPINNRVSGDKVKPMLINSQLPIEVLGKIWELSDIDKDGFLDKDEFYVCMHLVYKALEKTPVPQSLPPQLVPPSKRGKGAPVVGGVPVLPTVAARDSPVQRADSPAMAIQWVVNPVDKMKFDQMFKTADTDMDGFVSGDEIRSIFLQSGLPNTTLAHIWTLCDTNGVGKINNEQFALAMYLVQQKLKGVDPPATLTPEMIPPSMRPKGSTDTTQFGVTDGVNAGPYGHVADSSAIKELDIISKEIEGMKREKLQLERDSSQTEADIKICNGEVTMLQKELDAITATLQQLENQKEQAQKCLDELDEKKSDLESNVRDIREKCEAEQRSIEELKAQITNREMSVQYGSPVSTISNFSVGSTLDDFKDDPFKSKDAFGGDSSGGGSDPFQNEDPFKEGGDPFKSSSFGSDPFASDDPFKSSDAFEGTTKSEKGDPFGSVDPFASFGGSDNTKLDAFDPFGKSGSSGSSKPSKPDSLFGGDPFAPKSPSRPSIGPKSPVPALPPKQKKQPPPRPAPPKNRPTPSPSQQLGDFDSDPFAGNDPFASSATTSSDDAFANFADFSPSKKAETDGQVAEGGFKGSRFTIVTKVSNVAH
uniref:Epidermal growth factor receptor substrate 15-like 1 n=1 Tax=Magallana gigas TaxID=29159 RepID=K1PN15_MAGGI